MFFYFDSLLFEFVFQAFAWKFERWTGKDNFFLSQCCFIAIAIIVLLVSLAIPNRDVAFVIVTYFICACSIMLALTEFTARACNELDDNRENSNPIRNDSVVNKWVIFIIFALILPLWSVIALLNLYRLNLLFIGMLLVLSMIASSLYFLRCVPYPKEKKLMTSP